MGRRHAGLALLLAALVAAAPAAAADVGASATTDAAPSDRSGSGLARAERAGRIGFDLVVLRPLGVVLTAISLAGAAVAYPIAWPFGGEDQIVDYLVRDPVDRTFRRPLGEL